MNFRPITRLALLAAVLLGQVANQATADQPKADPAQELATQATGILRKYCHRCHGVQFKVPAYDVLKRDILVAPREGADPYITPGKPEKSELWDRMGSAEPQTGDAMPLSGPKPTDADKDIIKKWIVAGAPFPKATSRTPVRDQDIVKAMVDHLRGLDDGERRFWRYFTLATLYNNPSVRDDELRLARAAVSKLLNSLSQRRKIVVPDVLGPGQTIMAVDIRRLGWQERDAWSAILRAYPYGLKFNNRRNDEDLRRLAGELSRLIDDEVGLLDVRADWFIDSTSRPPSLSRDSRLARNRTSAWSSGWPSTSSPTSSTSISSEPDLLVATSLTRTAWSTVTNRQAPTTTGRATTFGPTKGRATSSSFPWARHSRAIHFRGWHSNMPAARSSSAFPTSCKRICWSRPTARESTTARPTSWATTRKTPARLRSSMACRAWAATKTACAPSRTTCALVPSWEAKARNA